MNTDATDGSSKPVLSVNDVRKGQGVIAEGFAMDTVREPFDTASISGQAALELFRSPHAQPRPRAQRDRRPRPVAGSRVKTNDRTNGKTNDRTNGKTDTKTRAKPDASPRFATTSSGRAASGGGGKPGKCKDGIRIEVV